MNGKQRAAAGTWTLVIVLVVASGALSPALAQKPASSFKLANSPYLKLAEPWPDADTLHARKVEAEQRRLFTVEEPLVLTLSADFKAVNADRTEGSTARYPATLSIGPDGAVTIPVKLGTRGHFRLRHAGCSQTPLRVEFPKKEVAGTIFDGQSALKLVTHCRDNYEQHVLREYLAYRIDALVAKLAFRARLAKITYVQATTGKPITTRYGMFLEDDRDVARRVEARSVELPRILFKDLDPEALNTMAVFEYMIGNTDVSLVKLHNVKLMVTESRAIYPVPYDFDFSGLIDAPYANPDPKLGIVTVQERLYRGPCRTEVELEPVLEKFRASKAQVMGLYDSLPDLTAGYRKQARSYLEEFYTIIGRPDRAKRALVDGCTHAGSM
jgi:hypothetical protein